MVTEALPAAKAETTQPTFYEMWDALLAVGPTLPEEEGKELLDFIRGAHSRYTHLFNLDASSQEDIELMNDLAEEVREQYQKYCAKG